MYQPAWSIHCLKISMGGWAPYSSLAGILRSSTNTTHFLPRGGPNTPFRLLSSLLSIISWVWFADVWAEKLSIILVNSSLSPDISGWFFTPTLLPVPVSPTHKTFAPPYRSCSMSHSCLMVSTVGTTMELNCASLGITNLAPGSTQDAQLPVLP